MTFRTGYASGGNLITRYLATQLRYRYDLTSVVGLHAHQSGYWAELLNPTSNVYTPEYEWGLGSENLLPLLRYVAAIYRSECQKDATCQHVLGSEEMWLVRVRDQTYVCRPIFAGKPPGRVTRVSIAYLYKEVGSFSNETIPFIVKTSYVDQSSRSREQMLYKQAHKGGIIPGLARLVAAEDSEGLIKGGGLERRKQAIVLGSIGEPLSQCTSVLELLKVVYDAVVSECNSHSA